MRIFVKNLPESTTENEIKNFFNKKGEVTDVYLVKNSKNIFRRICFVGFKTEQEALESQSYFNCTYFKNHKITVELASEDEKIINKTETQLRKALYSKTIIIKHLNNSITEDIIKNELSKFGKIIEINLNNFVAVVKFKDGESAEKVLKNLKMIAGIRVKVGNFIEKIKDYKKEHYNSLFFNFDSVIKKACENNIDKKVLLDLNDKNLGSKIAALETNLVNQTKAFLLKSNINIDKIEGLSKNIIILRNSDILGTIDLIKGDFKIKIAPSNNLALLEFKDEKEAEECVKEMNMKRFKNQVIYCEFAPICKIELPEDKNNEKLSKNKNNKVVVKNIPFQANINELKALFNTYIHIVDIRLPKKADGTHRGFGFVVLDSKENVDNFIETFGNSTHLYGRRLVLEKAKL